MATVDIRILAQNKENYGCNDGKIHWKMKGGSEFLIKNVDDSVMYYSSDEMNQAISAILKKRSNDHLAYELISWELLFSDPTLINADEFTKEIQSLIIS